MNDSRPARRREREITSHIDEGNIAFLGLISVQERIPEGFTRWDLEFEFQGRRASITCRGNPDYGGVPHGLDNDVSLAVLALYQRFGCPADGVIVTTAYQLLKLIGLDTSGYYYRALERSLGRLTHTTYTAREAWREGGRWESKQFRYLEKVHATGTGEGDGLDGKTVLKIELGKEIAASVRARYIKPLDLELLASLKRPPTRGLYRLLDGRRFAAGGAAVRVFEVGLLEWADTCKILDKRPEKIRRTLQGAHEELIQRGYLEGVEYVGRGKKQRIRYHFAPLQPVPDPAGVELLLAQGLSLPVAQRYAREYDLEHLRARVALYSAILEQGYRPRNRAGFLVDVIKDAQGKYANPADFAARRARPAAAAQGGGEEGEADALAVWRAMAAEERMNHLKTVCGMVFKRHFAPRDFELLFEALDEGRLEADAFYRELLAHSAPRKAAALAARLREGLGG
ncbi:replication initiator protein A [Calidithermus roseus]|uniref:Replication initiator protein A n=1 Tax=Calidithermus roseus TaxID=1644118 RepID=A0A399EI22_9DEIN|nr:replication initiator protein A [Calidithermus roseus]RIH84344.1 Replication initiator protein A [Calidithermus roseus]